MQQLIITLVALLGMIVPVANSRMTKLFQRIVPQMPLAGRMAAKSGTVSESGAATDSGTPVQSRPAGMAQVLSAGMQAGVRQPHLSSTDPQQRRMRRAQRATGWRNALSDHLQALASCRGFFSPGALARALQLPASLKASRLSAR